MGATDNFETNHTVVCAHFPRRVRRCRGGSAEGQASFSEDQLADAPGVGLAAHLPSSPRRSARRPPATLPARILSATSGLAAIAASTAAPSAPSSETTASPRAATTSAGEPSPASTPVDHLPGQLVVERARRRPAPAPRATCGRCDAELGQLDAGLVGAPGQLGQPPLPGALRRRARRHGRLDQRPRRRRSTTSRISRSVKPHSALHPRQPLGRRLGQRAAQLLHPLPARRHRHQIGLGEVAVVLRLLLARGPAWSSPVSSCQCRVSCLIVSPACSTGRLPGDLVPDRPLDRAQRVHVLGLGPGAERCVRRRPERDVRVAAQ